MRLEFISWKRYATLSVYLAASLSYYLESCRRICLSAFLIVPRTHPMVRVLSVLRQPVVIALGGAGIFNLLSIAYAFPPRLRVRLTQGRRALPWKP